MTRSVLSRCLGLAAVFGLFCLSSTQAQQARDSVRVKTQDRATGKSQDINFDRKYKSGQKFQLTAKASMRAASRLRRRFRQPDTEKARDAVREQRSEQRNKQRTDKKGRDQVRNQRAKQRAAMKEKSVNLTGELEIVKVSDDGAPTEIKLTVHRFKARDTMEGSAPDETSEKDDAEQFAKVKKGTVIIAKAGGEKTSYMFQKDNEKITGDLAKALKVILPVANNKKSQHNVTDSVSGHQKRRRGESWNLKKEDAPKSHKEMGLLYTRATFVAKKKLHGIDCAVVAFQSSVAPLTDRTRKRGKRKNRRKDTATDAKDRNRDSDAANDRDGRDKAGKHRGLKAVRASAFVYLPIKKDLPPLRTGGTIAFLVTKPRKGDASSTKDRDATAKSKKRRRPRRSFIEYTFSRDLRPLNGEVSDSAVRNNNSRSEK